GAGGSNGAKASRASASLGLRLVDRLMRQLGGTLAVEQNDPGTRVILRCPLGEPSAPAPR
ncbi:MAG TPA: hypothetical protein RMH80_20000, partial [Polyangiaceae bacterium LLY-WYZ-15_(1-7)]|nr:hypothetical protein [Polyangiaceae bacterium LLY-WYZ-15_(1-7)]